MKPNPPISQAQLEAVREYLYQAHVGLIDPAVRCAMQRLEELVANELGFPFLVAVHGSAADGGRPFFLTGINAVAAKNPFRLGGDYGAAIICCRDIETMDLVRRCAVAADQLASELEAIISIAGLLERAEDDVR